MALQDGLRRAAKGAAAQARRCGAGLGGFLRQGRNRRALLGTLALVAMVGAASWSILQLIRPPQPQERAATPTTEAALPAPRTSPDGRERPVPRHAEEPGLGREHVALVPDPPPPPPAPPGLELPAAPLAAPNLGEPEEPAAVAVRPEQGLPAWRKNAVATVLEPGRPLIAIVIDDLGPGHGAALKAIGLPGPLTLAFLPYAEDLANLTAKARGAGHELLVHMPMEPIDLAHNYPGPQALLTDLPLPEVQARLDWALGRFEGYVGINNHMGSAFSTWEPGLAVVMQALHDKGLLFLDSRTIGNSKAEGMALAYGVPATGRDVFLDNDAHDSAAIWAQLRQAERVALKRGSAIAIGHPHPATLQALAAWIPEMQARGFQLVPVSALVREDPAAGHVVQVGGQGGELR